MRNTRIMIGGAAALAVTLWTAPAFTQGQPVGPGTYACDGAVQAGPCHPDGDSSGESGNSGGIIDCSHRDPSEIKGYHATFLAMAVSLDGKEAEGSRNPSGIGGFLTAEEAAEDAIEHCEYEAEGSCKVVFSLPYVCAASITYKGQYVGFGHVPRPGNTSDNESAAKDAAAQAALASCIQDRGPANCPATVSSGDNRGCSGLVPYF